MAEGYCHRQYAESFAEFGQPRELPHCGGWLLERAIPETPLRDGMGCYPLFDCRNWSGLPADLTGLAGTLVSVSLVANPFANAAEADFRRWFDVVIPFKQHYVTDLRLRGLDIGRKHRRNVERARRLVHVDACQTPLELLGKWCDLYGQLVARHGITGLRAFSRAAFEKQLAVPGLVMFRALADDEIVGLHLWYVRDDVAYGHLGATSVRGYDLMASHALYWHAIQHFRDRVHWLDLGSGAGLSEGGSQDGLRQFKAGWATGTRQTFLCGRVLQSSAYDALTAERTAAKTSYFPAYREGEFVSPDTRLGTVKRP